MPFNRGRPRTRGRVRRVTLELDEALLAAVEVAAGASPLRVIVEAGLQMWLEQRSTGQSSTEDILRQHAQMSPPTPSDTPKGR